MTNPPVLLYFRGEFLRETMWRQRVAESELRTAIREKKFGSLDAIEVVVLESSGEFSVIESVGDGSALDDAFDEGMDV